MKLELKKKWMLVYSILFIPLSILFVVNDISNNYYWIYIFWMIISYTLMNIGNFLYTFNYNLNSIRKLWKIVFPLILITFFASMVVDNKFGKNSSPDDSLILNIITFIIGLLLFFPTFLANFMLALEKKK